jgi:hypothetical protein
MPLSPFPKASAAGQRTGHCFRFATACSGWPEKRERALSRSASLAPLVLGHVVTFSSTHPRLLFGWEFPSKQRGKTLRASSRRHGPPSSPSDRHRIDFFFFFFFFANLCVSIESSFQFSFFFFFLHFSFSPVQSIPLKIEPIKLTPLRILHTYQIPKKTYTQTRGGSYHRAFENKKKKTTDSQNQKKSKISLFFLFHACFPPLHLCILTAARARPAGARAVAREKSAAADGSADGKPPRTEPRARPFPSACRANMWLKEKTFLGDESFFF